MHRHQVVWDGAVAGFLGAVTVALWFLVFDLSRGKVLETPTLLGAALLHGGIATAIPQYWYVLEYTIVHFAAFLLFGIVAAALIEAAEWERSLLIALLMFLFAFEVMFIAVVLFRGPVLAAALSWWSVLAGNLLATAVMFAYFFGLRHPHLLGPLFGPWVNIVFEGVCAGLIGATVVAVWFLLCDLGVGEPFRTPSLLGGMLLQGIRDPAAIKVTVPLILAYTVLHYTVFILFGVAVSSLVAASEREPMLLLALMVLFVCFEVFFLGFAAVLNHALLDQIGWSLIVAANLMASVAMLGYFYMRHRTVPMRLIESWTAIAQE